jgi:hypothetical protein
MNKNKNDLFLSILYFIKESNKIQREKIIFMEQIDRKGSLKLNSFLNFNNIFYISRNYNLIRLQGVIDLEVDIVVKKKSNLEKIDIFDFYRNIKNFFVWKILYYFNSKFRFLKASLYFNKIYNKFLKEDAFTDKEYDNFINQWEDNKEIKTELDYNKLLKNNKIEEKKFNNKIFNENRKGWI